MGRRLNFESPGRSPQNNSRHELRLNLCARHWQMPSGDGARVLNLKSFAKVEPTCHAMRQVLIESGINCVAGAVSVRLHHGGPQGAKPKAEVIADILASIKERRA